MDWVNYKRISGDRIIHAEIDGSATWGVGTVIWHHSVILQNVRIGDECSIGSRCEIGRGCVIKDRTRIGSGVFLPPNSIIGQSVFIGPNVTFTDDKHPKVPAPGDPPYNAQPPIVDDHAVIGAGCTILPGVRIGSYAIVGAGSVVTTDVPAATMVKGCPARAFEPSKYTRAMYIEDLSRIGMDR